METKSIKVDWSSEKSIKAAERTKLKLENAGWSLSDVIQGGPWSNESTLIYVRKL